MSDELRASYDDLPYAGMPLPFTHPDVLRTVAWLYGLDAPPTDTWRVLELGCGTGFNLIATAQYLPRGHFLGIDLSPRQIETGQALVKAAGLQNCYLAAQSILDLDANRLGKFDAVVAHGVYSWVPEPVRAHMLALCRDCLAPTGIAYLSYNTYPGWHLKRIARDALLYGGRAGETLADRVREGRALLDVLANQVPGDTAYNRALRTAATHVAAEEPFYIAHEYLEPINQPFLFRDVIDTARGYGLQYLQEASPSPALVSLPHELIRGMMNRATDLIDLEQLFDFCIARAFRVTLLCRDGHALIRDGGTQRMALFHATAAAEPAVEALTANPNDPEEFRTLTGETMTATSPLVKLAVRVLRSAWPQALPFDELRDRVGRLLAARGWEPAAGSRWRDQFTRTLFQCYVSHLARIHRDPLPVTTTLPERPDLTALTRHLIGAGESPVNRYHQRVTLTDAERAVAVLCDSTRTVTQIKSNLAELAARGGDESHAQHRERLRASVEPALRRLASAALL